MPRFVVLVAILGSSATLAGTTALVGAGAAPARASAGPAAPGPRTTVFLPGVFHRVLPAVKRRTRVPVLLPGRVPSELSARHLFPTGGGSRRAYDLELGAVRRCGGANACFVGAFSGKRGGRPSGRRVRLRGGVRGYFIPTGCGASCSAPQVSFVRGGVVYVFQYRSGAKIKSRSEKDVMIGLASSALRAGPR